jgi:hypothetical protein
MCYATDNMLKRKLPDSISAAPAEVKAQKSQFDAGAIAADGVCILSTPPISPPKRVVPKGSPADAFQQLLPPIQAVEVMHHNTPHNTVHLITTHQIPVTHLSIAHAAIHIAARHTSSNHISLLTTLHTITLATSTQDTSNTMTGGCFNMQSAFSAKRDMGPKKDTISGGNLGYASHQKGCNDQKEHRAPR